MVFVVSSSSSLASSSSPLVFISLIIGYFCFPLSLFLASPFGTSSSGCSLSGVDHVFNLFLDGTKTFFHLGLSSTSILVLSGFGFLLVALHHQSAPLLLSSWSFEFLSPPLVPVSVCRLSNCSKVLSCSSNIFETFYFLVLCCPLFQNHFCSQPKRWFLLHCFSCSVFRNVTDHKRPVLD